MLWALLFLAFTSYFPALTSSSNISTYIFLFSVHLLLAHTTLRSRPLVKLSCFNSQKHWSCPFTLASDQRAAAPPLPLPPPPPDSCPPSIPHSLFWARWTQPTLHFTSRLLSRWRETWAEKNKIFWAKSSPQLVCTKCINGKKIYVAHQIYWKQQNLISWILSRQFTAR